MSLCDSPTYFIVFQFYFQFNKPVDCFALQNFTEIASVPQWMCAFIPLSTYCKRNSDDIFFSFLSFPTYNVLIRNTKQWSIEIDPVNHQLIVILSLDEVKIFWNFMAKANCEEKGTTSATSSYCTSLNRDGTKKHRKCTVFIGQRSWM